MSSFDLHAELLALNSPDGVQIKHLSNFTKENIGKLEVQLDGWSYNLNLASLLSAFLYRLGRSTAGKFKCDPCVSK